MNRFCAGKCVPARLPARRNAIETAKRNKEQSLLPAITIASGPAIIANIPNRRVLEGVAVLDVLRDPIKKLLRLQTGICFITGDLLRQRSHFRSENHVRPFTCERLEFRHTPIARLDLPWSYIK